MFFNKMMIHILIERVFNSIHQDREQVLETIQQLAILNKRETLLIKAFC
jgi:hypothetical protein